MSDGFNFDELDKFNENMLDFVNDVKTKETKKFVKKSANKLRSKEKKTYDSMGIGLEETATPEDKKMRNRFRSGKPYKYGGNWSCRAFNSAPHAHLINNGFVHKGGKDKKGKEAWIPGYHFIEKSTDGFEEEYAEMVENFMNEAIHNHGF